MRVEREGIEDHWTDECDVGSLAVVNPLVCIDPESGKFRKNLDSLECFQIVNENVWYPEVVDQLQVH